MISIRGSRLDDGERVVAIWQAALDATHHFVAAEDRAEIIKQAQSYLLQAFLWLAVDSNDWAIGFMGLSGPHLEALFVDPDYHGVRVGRKLVMYALALQPLLTTEVNEQNEQALGFYKKMGFVPIGRSPFDDQGRPYPLIQMRLGSA